MKNKAIVILILMMLSIYFGITYVNAYSPHYLPGGKNYLTEENFIEENTDYLTYHAFLVKPYSDYTITIPRLYADERWNPIEIICYDNDLYVETFSIDFNDMEYYHDGVNEWYYYTFKTSSDSNYMEIVFDNESNYFSINGLNNIQLEEGITFTGYEQYIEGALIDTSAPYFQNAGTIVSYYDSPITVEEIQSALIAYDAVDGDVTSSITLISDGYTPNNQVLGEYSVLFEVSDSSNNTSQIDITVEVVDILKPVFSDLGIIQAVYPNSYSLEDILSMLSASDNYDGDISSNITLVTDNYTSHSSVTGIYYMTFEVVDSSGNSETYIQEIQVVDNQGPIISGISDITIGYDHYVSEEDIKSNLTYTDNYDDQGTLTLVLENDTYSENRYTLGTYEMEFSVTDSSGNTTTKTITVEVVDELGPMVYFNSSIIQTYNDAVMALPDFIQLLRNTNEIERNIDYYVTIKYDSYTKNAHVPGIYHLTLNFENDNGEELQKDLEIRVIDRPFDYIDIARENQTQNLSIIEEYLEYFIGGAGAVLLVVSNLVWIGVLRKRK